MLNYRYFCAIKIGLKKNTSTYFKLSDFRRWKIVLSIRAKLSETVLPGFMGCNLMEVIDFIFFELKKNDISTRANSMSFSFFISLFPSLLSLFTALAYFPIHKNYNTVITTYINELLPGNAGSLLLDTIKDITTKPRGSLLSFGFVLAIYFSSNGLLSMISGFTKSYPITFRNRSWIMERVVAIQMTFLLGFLLIASFLLIIFGNMLIIWLLKLIKASMMLSVILTLLRWLVIVALFFLGIGIIYKIGMPLRKKLKIVSPGTMVATFFSILSSILFSNYIENFGNYNKVYGSIGSIIVLMLWIQINAFILLVGFELNAAIAVRKDLKVKSLNDASIEHTN